MTYTDEMIQAVWEKGRGMPDRNVDEWRKDQCGAWLQRGQYHNPHSEYGWEILNTMPGPGTELDNLAPFHWQNGFDVALGQPQCRVQADRSDLAPGQRVDHPRNSTS